MWGCVGHCTHAYWQLRQANNPSLCKSWVEKIVNMLQSLLKGYELAKLDQGETL